MDSSEDVGAGRKRVRFDGKELTLQIALMRVALRAKVLVLQVLMSQRVRLRMLFVHLPGMRGHSLIRCDCMVSIA